MGCGRRRRLAGQAVRRPCTHEQGAAVATCSAASRRTRARWVAAQGGAGRRALGPGCGDGRPTAGETSSAGERKKVPAVVLLTGKEEDGLGKRSNDGGFGKRRTCRCRGRRDLPLGGDGFRWRRSRWPEKLAGNLAVENFGVRSVGLRVAARKTGCTSEILVLRATPTYI